MTQTKHTLNLPLKISWESNGAFLYQDSNPADNSPAVAHVYKAYAPHEKGCGCYSCQEANNESEERAQFIVTACNWYAEAKEALTEIALICEQDQDKTDWQDILRRANSALEHLQSAQGKE